MRTAGGAAAAVCVLAACSSAADQAGYSAPVAASNPAPELSATADAQRDVAAKPRRIACRTGSSLFDTGRSSGVMYVPPHRSGKTPVVVVLHGIDSDGPGIRRVTEFNVSAREHGFAVLYPTAPGGQWRVTRSAQVAAINSLPGSLRCADPRHAYLVGFSWGSAMTFQVACSSQPRRYAAFGGVAYANYDRRCADAPPAPWIYLHGTGDQTVPFGGGDEMYPGYRMPPVTESMRKWAAHNHCQEGPSTLAVGSDTVYTKWSRCAQRADVHFYAIDDGDHQWPFQERPDAPLLKYGQSWAGIGATDAMWSFFRTRSLAGA